MDSHRYIATPSRTQQILKKHNFTFKKSLGQNFLIDVNILKNIIKHAGITKASGVVEIGPGIGSLTEQLALHARSVIAFEIDERLKPVLRDTLEAYNNVHLIFADILEANIHEAIQKHFKGIKDIHIVANLPYYITTPIVMKLLKDCLPITRLTIMIQKEVAARMSASPKEKDYGSLSIAVQYYTEAKTVMEISPQVFMPRPKVDSAVLTLTLRKDPPVVVKDETYFFALVRASFAQRRKTLRNNMINYFQDRLSRDMITETIERAKIDPRRRGETLTMQEFATLANAFYEIDFE